jgi:uncharacterized repeat protein (TIGR03803 family)
LYGAAPDGGAGGVGTVFSLRPPPIVAGKPKGGWGFTTLYAFTVQDGAAPVSTPVFDQHGTLYGTTFYGGDGCGVVFGLTPGGPPWTLSTLFKFDCGSQGGIPAADLTFDASFTSLYGTTMGGNGTVYRLTP